jgi:lysophospholipase L1-like esterase
MILRRLLCCLLVPALFAALLAAPGAADASTPTYYVSLGDSLAKGYMPGPGDTNQGYADDLYVQLHLTHPTLQLVKLGCSGETTGTMINGGHCANYPVGSSQLDAAVAFLKAHQNAVTYLTLDIGANDVDNCAPNGSIDLPCVANGVTTIVPNLQTILTALTAADGRKPRSVGMNYYDPFLAEWLTGSQGELVATASVGALAAVNSAEATEYQLYGFGVADVAAAYKTGRFAPLVTLAPYGKIPTNVATICKITYMCTQQNIHPTTAGYRVIANAFKAKMS